MPMSQFRRRLRQNSGRENRVKMAQFQNPKAEEIRHLESGRHLASGSDLQSRRINRHNLCQLKASARIDAAIGKWGNLPH